MEHKDERQKEAMKHLAGECKRSGRRLELRAPILCIVLTSARTPEEGGLDLPRCLTIPERFNLFSNNPEVPKS